MAKKMKPVSVDAASVADVSEIQNAEEKQSTVIEQIEARLSDGERAANGTLTDDVKTKLAAYETAMAENARLSEEISNLQDQLAEYIANSTDIAKNAKTGDSKKIVELESRINELTDENDKYLMRISELSFENAKLTASMQEMSKHQPAAKPQDNAQHMQYAANPYRGFRDSNGYTSWN